MTSEVTSSPPVTKSAKGHELQSPAVSNKVSKIFAPFRVLGRVCNGVKSLITYRGGVPYITTSVGRSFHIYDVETLNLCFVSTELAEDIRALLNKEDLTIALTVSGFHIFDRSRLVKSIQCDKISSFVSAAIMGSMVIVLCERSILLFSLPDLALTEEIDLDNGDLATSFVHPPTYLNKILIGFKSGKLQLWNINTKKCIYTFNHHSTPISALEASPVVDVVAVGLEEGTVWMMDVKKDALLFSLKHRSVPSLLSFRTTKSDDAQLLVSLGDGSVALWDLNERRLFYSWNAHSCPVATCTFLTGLGIIITAAGDNSIKEWLLDGPEVRYLKGRSGHAKAPRQIRFYDEDGDTLLSAGDDKSFRLLSLIKDSQNVELSQGSLGKISKKLKVDEEELKFDPIIAFDCFATKDLKWDNVITGHISSPIARTWRVDHRKVGAHELRSKDGHNVSAVAVSACGNYGLIATVNGAVDCFNLQSGMHRKHYVGPNSSIVGIGLDASNAKMVIAHANGLIRVLDFISGVSITEISLPITSENESITLMSLLADAFIVAVAVSNHEILVIDLEGGKIVRRFVGHQNCINDFTFSRDSRWLLSCAADGTTRVWDLIIGKQVDAINHPTGCIPLSLTLSPNLDILAIAFSNDVAIHTFTNLTLYRPVALEVTSSHHVSGISMNATEEDLLGELVQLSLEPKTKWHTLYHLDSIKSRNKPVLPPKIVEKAPFFLDALLSSGNKRDSEGAEASTTAETSLFETQLVSLLKIKSKSASEVISYMIKLSPAQIDLEIQALHATPLDPAELLITWIRVLCGEVDGRNNYDLAITFLNFTLRIHSQYILSEPEVFREVLEEASFATKSTWKLVEPLFQRSQCLLSFSRDSVF